MAISQTMSNPSDWIFLPYQNDSSHATQAEIPAPSAFAVATTSSAAIPRNNNLSPEQGRVSKPAIRKRSRASRRTPTTLLNTDTTNFRAMVQHFTGGPAAPFAARGQIPNRGGGAALNYMAATNAPVAPASGFQVQYPNQMQQQQQMFVADNMHGGEGAGGLAQSAAENGNRSYDNYML